MTEIMTREVWKWNRDEEMKAMNDCLTNFRYIAMDTEFPGCLRETRKDATDNERYNNMKFSVDRTDLIQLGLTLFDLEGRIGGTWEINLCDFGEAGSPKSLDFLKRNGLNLDKIREDGVCIQGFFSDLSCILRRRKDITWVTFHGSYDLAYLLKHLTGRSLPTTSLIFSKALAMVLGGSFYDLKVMASRFEGLSSRLGLEGLAEELGVSRLGSAHHAGSDSDLTARVFIQLAQICHDLDLSEGIIYGIDHMITSKPQSQMMMMTRVCYGPPPPPPRPMFVLPPPRHLFVPPPFGGYVLMPPRVLMC